MSGGTACKCEEKKKDISARNWVVFQLKCNHSAFNGYHRTPSDWSSVGCNNCHATWRTKSAYVYQLKAHKEPTA